jgi:glucokinase
MLLAGDVGGTKTNLAVYSAETGPRKPLIEATFPSSEYTSLESIVSEFLGQQDLSVSHASFGVAGPVISGHVEITNLPWGVDKEYFSEALKISEVHLLNDLQAVANAVPYLEPQDIYTLHPVQPQPEGGIAVVAPGTGLGEAYLTWDGTRYRAYSSEGGHADFAPTNELQRELLRFLHEERGFARVSYERVCSGKGIPNIYDFLKISGYALEPTWLAEQLAAADDPTPVIANCALDEEHPPEICTLTLETFVSILGAECGNMALKVLATGGVYLGGGIPPRILPALKGGRFLNAFMDKGRLSDLLEGIPVYVILNPKAALLGAACYGLDPG